MARSILFIFVLLSVLLLAVAPVFSADEVSPPEKVEWNPYSAGPLVTWSAPLVEPGMLQVYPQFYYYRIRGVFNDKGNYKSYTNGERQSQYLGQLNLYCGLIDKLELDFQGGYRQNYRKVDGNSANDGWFDDSLLYLRYCINEETQALPCITAITQIKLPTGKYQKADPDKLGTDLTGTGSYDPALGIVFTKKMEPFIFHADCIYNIPVITRVDGAKVRYANYIQYDFAIEYFFFKGFNLLLEANCFSQGDAIYDGERAPGTDSAYVQLSPGIGWSNKYIQTLLVYQRTVAGTNTYVKDSVAVAIVSTF